MSVLKGQRGVTLIELIVVMSIITILAGVALPGIGSLIRRQREDESAARMKEIQIAVKAYARDLLQVPNELRLLASSTAASWRGPYIQDQMQGISADPDFAKDAWSNAFAWSATSNEEGQLVSAGANGVLGDADDLSLTIDVRPILREITIERMAVINAAIRLYNLRHQGSSPLTGSVAQVLATLQIQGFLSASAAVTKDAFGATWLADGSPVTALYSSKVLNGH